jgi:D-tyrosyl-tRNA(Tyr) deacylase
MKILLTRVHKAAVSVVGERVASISKGIVIFVGIEKTDTDSVLVEMARKVLNMRVFEEEGKLDKSVSDKNCDILCIPNFTLCGRTAKGRRPSFDEAMEPAKAKRLIDDFARLLSQSGLHIETGAFGRHMDIQLDLDGPVNIILESK